MCESHDVRKVKGVSYIPGVFFFLLSRRSSLSGLGRDKVSESVCLRAEPHSWDRGVCLCGRCGGCGTGRQQEENAETKMDEQEQ